MRQLYLKVFHSGTEIIDGKLVTSGGRVISISGIAEDKKVLGEIIYSKMEQIKFHGKHFRNDIGFTERRSK